MKSRRRRHRKSREPTKCAMSLSPMMLLGVALLSVLLMAHYGSSDLWHLLSISTLRQKWSGFFNYPQSFCSQIPFDAFNASSNVTYLNDFPANISIAELMKRRTEDIGNIPMCPNGDGASFNMHSGILSKLPPNYIQYANRCQINAISRGTRQFGGLLSGDPINSEHSTQIGFLHVFARSISVPSTLRDTVRSAPLLPIDTAL